MPVESQRFDSHALRVLLNEAGVAAGFHQSGNPGRRLHPRKYAAICRNPARVFRIAQTVVAVNVVQQSCPFRAECPRLTGWSGSLQYDKWPLAFFRAIAQLYIKSLQPTEQYAGVTDLLARSSL